MSQIGSHKSGRWAALAVLGLLVGCTQRPAALTPAPGDHGDERPREVGKLGRSVAPPTPEHTGAVTASNERRTALVVGNGAYSVGPLSNPPRDARLMASTLTQVGFEVELKLDVNQAELKRSIASFGEKLTRGGVGFFYYAGHGMQVNGQNYLIPIGANIHREADVDIEAVRLDSVLIEMGEAKNRVNIVALDACRDNPFARSFRSGARGLVLTNAPMGTLVSYATGPGQVAADGDGANSPYTSALARNMTKAMPVEELFKAVRREVKSMTQDRQTPWELSSLEGNFSFVEGAASPAGPPASGPLAATCPSGSALVGNQCVRTAVVTETKCPAGSTFDGKQCVGAVGCPPGTSWDGKACVGAAGAASPAPAVFGPGAPRLVRDGSSTLDTKSRLTWRAPFAAKKTLAAASRACAELGARLPTEEEAMSLSDLAAEEAALFGDTNGFFWTSTRPSRTSNRVLTASVSGQKAFSFDDIEQVVRCVR